MENSGIGRVESNSSAQKAETVALTKAMEISTDQVVNIYTDSSYAYGQVVQNWIPRNLKPESWPQIQIKTNWTTQRFYFQIIILFSSA